MTNNENSNRDPRKRLYRVLDAHGWTEDHDGLWQDKWGVRKIYIDSIGIFLYLFQHGQWVRTGLSHNLIKTAHLEDGYLIFSDNRRIYL